MGQGKFIDMTGQKFGRMTALEFFAGGGGKKPKWLCRCECGIEKKVTGYQLRSGKTKSCGCLRNDKSSERFTRLNTKHGHTGTPSYHVWGEMMRRCERTTHVRYVDYGGRGIKVCERWRTYESYLADMYPKPGPGYSMDRIDNDGDYSPDNCRWATHGEQARNKRTSVLIEHEGQSKTAPEWSEIVGTLTATILWRHHQGWTSHEVMHGRAPANSAYVMHEGKKRLIAEVARETGVNYYSMMARKYNGCTDEQIINGLRQ